MSERKYRPFQSFDEARSMIGKPVISKNAKALVPLRFVVGVGTDCLGFDNGYCSFQEAFDSYEKIDGTLIGIEVATPKPKPLVLQVGKWYKRRDGKIVGPIKSFGRESHYLYHFTYEDGYHYTKNGEVWCNGPSSGDLIEEVPAPKVWRKPTLDDLKNGPVRCRMSDYSNKNSWFDDATLCAISVGASDVSRFYCQDETGDRDWWAFCEIEVEGSK